MDILDVVILSVVEGLTEFLPISSTGHMILAQWLLGIPADEFTKAFVVNIQFGAILSVVVLYWRRFFQSWNFYLKLFVAFLPAAVIGFFAGDLIDMFLESVLTIGITLLLGGILLLFVDQWFSHSKKEQEMTYLQALKIGFFQVIAMIPGVSRSAATIVGGMQQGFSRTQAAEFSFFLAVPTMFGATVYKLLKSSAVFTQEHRGFLILGNGIAFVVAMIAIKSFINFLTKHGFKGFGWYRIVIGAAILMAFILGADLSLL